MQTISCIYFFAFSSFTLGLKMLPKLNYRMILRNIKMTTTNDIESLGLTPTLEKYSKALNSVRDDKLRYQQLLFLASKCKPMPEEYKVPENKVPGCLSTVHIHATEKDGKIFYLGDSDAQLTKGLVALLVEGLSGHTQAEIENVKPEFIQYAGVGSSLTPGRNNGFLNMMKVMKDKARNLSSELKASDKFASTSSMVVISIDYIYCTHIF